MRKIIISDVDGTLVPDGHPTINPEYFGVIERLFDEGILFIAASGRQCRSLVQMFHPVLEKMAFISEGGSCIWKEGVPMVPNPLPGEYVREIAEDVRKIEGAEFMAGTPGYSLCPHEGTPMYRWLTEGYRFDLRPLGGWDFPEDVTYCKTAIYFPKKVEEATRDFREKWKGKIHMALAGDMWLDLSMPGVNKGHALGVIQKDLGINKKDIMAFGDNQNDREMMELSGTSYAVTTAIDEIKDIADGMVPNYKEDGVLKVIKEVLRDHE